MSFISGVHGAPWVNDETIRRLKLGRFRFINMFDFQPVADYRRLQCEVPGIKFGLRLYHPMGELPDPRAFADQAGYYTRQLWCAGIKLETVAPLNEPNLEYSHLGPQACDDWFVEFYHRYREWDRITPLAFPALCPSLDVWNWWLGCRRAIQLGEHVHAHVYAQSHELVLNSYEGRWAHWIAEQRPDAPLYVTEYSASMSCPDSERMSVIEQLLIGFREIPTLQATALFILDHDDPDWQPFILSDHQLNQLAKIAETP